MESRYDVENNEYFIKCFACACMSLTCLDQRANLLTHVRVCMSGFILKFFVYFFFIFYSSVRSAD